jgi:RNA polymerase sigma-70 factor (ECF subfamily)
MESKRMWSEQSAPPEAQLVRQVAQGDRDAFAALYDLYAKPLYSLILRILSDPKEAEDVLQEVFLQLWEKAGAFDEAAGKPFSWVVTMTRNKAIDRIRSRQRRSRLFEEASGSIEATASETAAPAPIGVEQDEAAQIRTALNALPKEQRQAIEMAFFRGLTHSEIAEALREPLGTVKARIRRGMLQLRDYLEGQI